MLNVCDPCLIVITRAPRRCSSAQSRTVSVVLPLCFLPITATIGGRGMSLRALALVGGVDVHEEKRRIAERRHDVRWYPHHVDVVIERDDATVAGRDPSLDRRDARRRIIRAQWLEPAA